MDSVDSDVQQNQHISLGFTFFGMRIVWQDLREYTLSGDKVSPGVGQDHLATQRQHQRGYVQNPQS